jgi:DNA modification methylase
MMAKTKTKKGPDYITAQLWPLALPIGDLLEDPSNARLHNDRNINAIKSSLQKFGQRKPVVLNKQTGIVLAGNGTLTAARALGWEYLATVIVDDDPATATGFAIADNRTAELATWDDEVLARLLEAVEEEMPAIELGFTDEDLAELLNMDAGPIGEDVEPIEAPKDPISKRGEVYELGPHRLMCGDSTSKEDVDALLDGATPNLMVTDPPYGVNYDAGWRNEAADAGLIAHAARRVGKVENDDRADWREAWELFPGPVAYAWCPPGSDQFKHEAALSAAGFVTRMQMIWAKPRFAISRGHYHHQHEPCWYAVRKGATASWAGDRSQTTLWPIALDANVEGGHSTQKPLECMERPIRNHEGDVYDPFLGSGTTIIAAARQGRRCYGLEISPAYCDVIRKRWGDYARQNDLEPGAGAL